MKILITLPRSGSHLAGRVLDCAGFTAVRKDGPPFGLEHITNRLKTGQSVWFHYPFSQELYDYLQGFDAEKYVLLRDPRDIIVSMSHRVEDYPGALVNYKHEGNRLSHYPFTERMDILIEMMREPFADFDQWRQAGLTPVHYSEFVKHPVAETFTEQKRRGVVGAYKSEMTPEQIERANQSFGDLVYLWEPHAD